MAPKKLQHKRARNEGTSVPPPEDIIYDEQRFRSTDHQLRFEAIQHWSFLKERRVQLFNEEYADFADELNRRRWRPLVTPLQKFDPEIVLEFYANAWPMEGTLADKRSFVRGQWIPYDADAINQFLGNPLVLPEGHLCEYMERRNEFDEEAMKQLMCIPGTDFARGISGNRVRLMRTNMTTLTQIWMTFVLSNILPSDHNSDLPMLKCQLVYSILIQLSIDVGQIISDVIHQFVILEPTRHPLNPERANRALGFPALITRLCQLYGIPLHPSRTIRPPINRAFIEKYCLARQVEQQPEPATLESISAHMQRMELQMHTYMQHIADQQAANFRGQVQLNESFYHYTQHQYRQDPSPFPWPTPDQFRTHVAWPGDRPTFPEEEGGPAAQQDPAAEDPAATEGEAEDDLERDMAAYLTDLQNL